MSIQISEISSETAKNDTVKTIQNASKSITELFNYINSNNPSITDICVKYKFEDIELKQI